MNQPLRKIVHPVLRPVSRCPSGKHHDVFMSPHRFVLRVDEIRRPIFVPHPTILELIEIAGNQLGGERLCGSENDGGFWLRDSPQFLPHLREGNNRIPSAIGCAVWWVGQNQINRVVGKSFEGLKTIFKVNFCCPHEVSRGASDIYGSLLRKKRDTAANIGFMIFRSSSCRASETTTKENSTSNVKP